MNYGFRKVCNRCKIERKEEYPSIFLEPNQKINGNNNNSILMNNYNNLQLYLNSDNSQKQNTFNNFVNNNIKNNINSNINNDSNNDNFNFNNNNN